MDYVSLGRTGLRVSVMGLGAGGFSRLGQGTGRTEDQSVAVVRRALDLGITFVDTAEAYRTEAIVDQGIRGRRDQVVLSTKKSISRDGALISADDVIHGLEDSLQRLGTDRVEIYHLHGVAANQYDYARDVLNPALQKLRQQGKIRFTGITEAFASDPGHAMMSRAVQDDCWDVVMVGFNILNQSARQRIFPHTIRKGIGVLNMFAVRSALSRPAKLRETMDQLYQQNLIAREGLNESDPLNFLLHAGGAQSLPDAAYRFCRQEPGVHVVLSGTGNLEHLEENVASILRPPLPEKDRQRLMEIFAKVDNVSGQ